jgi:hypothetical protein
MIEEIEERFTEDETTKLLKLIVTILPDPSGQVSMEPVIIAADWKIVAVM